MCIRDSIYISGLQTVPEDVYEAGAIDGVSGWKKFWSLTFPLIIPFFSINMVLCMKNFLMVFDQIMALTKGGPAQSTESISYLIYNNGMSGGQFGFQSAKMCIRDRYDNIGLQDYEGAFELISYLLRLGHRNIAFFSDQEPPMASNRERFRGCLLYTTRCV